MTENQAGTHLQVKLSAFSERLDEHAAHINQIKDVASQVNMLAINAAIEAARALNQAEALKDQILDSQMVIQAFLVAEILTHHAYDESPVFWQSLAHRAGLDAISITDGECRVVMASEPSRIGWIWPRDPNSQTYRFTQLVDQKNGVYCQPMMRRTVDDTLYKYVGITRPDQPGVVQVGFKAETLSKINISVNVFGFIAQEMSRLSELIKQPAKTMEKSQLQLAADLAQIQSEVKKMQR